MLGEVIRTKVPSTPQSPHSIGNWVLRVGEGFAGPPVFEIAHIDLLIGEKKGPVDVAVREALDEDPSQKRVKIITDKPLTLLVPTITVRTRKQAELIYKYATRGIKKAIHLSIKDGFLPLELCKEITMLLNVFVHPSAVNRVRVEFNNYKAMRHAIRRAIEGRPTLEEIEYEKEAARHPFRYTP